MRAGRPQHSKVCSTTTSWPHDSVVLICHVLYLSDFQLTYARREWSEERASWRAVIQLNLVRNVNQILDHLTQEMSGSPSDGPPNDDSTEDLPARRAPKTLPPLRFKEKHRLLKLRLGPLGGVQADLERKLGAASTELYTTSVMIAAPFDHATNRKALQEFSINSTNGWKTALDKFRNLRVPRPENGSDPLRNIKDIDEDITEIIASCKDDIKAIWEDSLVNEMLNRRKVRIEDSPGL